MQRFLSLVLDASFRITRRRFLALRSDAMSEQDRAGAVCFAVTRAGQGIVKRPNVEELGMYIGIGTVVIIVIIVVIVLALRR